MAAALGMNPNNSLLRLAALGVLGVVLVGVLSRNLVWGMFALVPLAFLVDVQFGTGTKVALNPVFLLTLLLIGLWLLRMLVVERALRLKASPVNLPALAFVLAASLAWVASFLPIFPLSPEKPSLFAQLGAYLLYVLSVGAMLLAANLFEDRRTIRAFTWVYLGFGAVYLLAQVIPRSSAFVINWFNPAQTGSAVYWGLLTALSLGQALFNNQLARPLRFGLAGTALAAFLFAFLARPEWLAGWFAALIAIITLLWLWKWRIGLISTLVGLSIAAANYAALAARVNTETQIWSTYSRFVTWPIVYQLTLANPVTGLGPANYHYYASMYSLLGYFIRFNTHNNYFDIILQTGLVGLACFLWLVGVLILLGFWLRRHSADGFERGYANGLLAGIAAILAVGFTADYFLPFVYNIGITGFQTSVFFWLFCGGLISLYAIEKKRSE